MTVTNKNLDLSAGGLDPKSTVGLVAVDTVTSTEQTLTVTPHPAKRTRLLISAPDQPWGLSRTTGAYSTKKTYPANVECEIVIPADSTLTPIVFFWQAASTSATVGAMAAD